MNSINEQQPEDNLENLYGKEAINKVRELTDKASTCFFCTNINTGKPFSVRPMTVQKIDDAGALWFLSAVDSFKDQELESDPHVQLLFQGSDYTDFLNVYGTIQMDQTTKHTNHPKLEDNVRRSGSPIGDWIWLKPGGLKPGGQPADCYSNARGNTRSGQRTSELAM